MEAKRKVGIFRLNGSEEHSPSHPPPKKKREKENLVKNLMTISQRTQQVYNENRHCNRNCPGKDGQLHGWETLNLEYPGGLIH